MEQKRSKKSILLAGIFSENPTLALVLGMCPVIIATQSIDNTVGMSAAVLIVLVMSNLIISLIRNLIPSEIRIPVYIVIIASLVTCVQLLMEAYTASLAAALGVFLPLITVNCIILGRAEAFASKNTPLDSILDAVGMSLGFFMACLIIAIFREFLGTGGFTLTNPFTEQSVSWLPLADYAIPMMVGAPGGFLWVGIVIGLFRMGLDRYNRKKAVASAGLASGAACC